MADRPDTGPLLRRAQALRDAGLHDEAELALGDAARQFPDSEQVAVARASLASVRRDWGAAESRWAAARGRFPENPWCHLGSINALRGAGRAGNVAELIAAATAALEVARQRGLGAPEVCRTEFEIARVASDWPGLRDAAARLVDCGGALTAPMHLAVAQACLHLGELDAAKHSAEAALALDPALVEAWIVRAQAATGVGDGETALACYRALVRVAPNAFRWRLKLVQLLGWLGRVPEALDELAGLRFDHPSNPMVRSFLRGYRWDAPPATGADARHGATARTEPDLPKDDLIDRIAEHVPAAGRRVRPLLDADPRRDVIVAEAAGADAAVLLFTGTSDELWMPLLLFDQYLATHRITAVYLKDFHRLRYLRGIVSLGDDVATTAAALRELTARMGVKRLYTLGNCVGGFAAIRYGVELGAERVLAFSPPTQIAPETPLQLEEGRRFMKRRLEMLVDPDLTDLAPYLRNRRFGGDIQIMYEQDDPRDAVQALRLTGLPGVRLRPLPAVSGRSLTRFAADNEDFAAWLGAGLDVPAEVAS